MASEAKVVVTVVLRGIVHHPPSVGDTLLTVGAVVSLGDVVVSTVQVWLAGVESVLPAESVAFTPKLFAAERAQCLRRGPRCRRRACT